MTKTQTTNPENTAQFYDVRGERIIQTRRNVYQERFQDWLAYGVISELERRLPSAAEPNQPYLDLCSGTGLYSIEPAKKGFLVTGVAVSAKSVAASQWLAEVSK
jgi:tRNA/tmRNA/rRNA uracil-C5-methylase (TrmA/RlmC/RlmD family)